MSKVGKTYQKISPFRYPTKKHQRTEIPPVYANYRDYKPHLKREFSGRCVYCRKADGGQDLGSFHVEHYRPKGLFPELLNKYDNYSMHVLHAIDLKVTTGSLTSRSRYSILAITFCHSTLDLQTNSSRSGVRRGISI